MQASVAHRQLGRILWDIAGVETGAATACGLLLSTPFLLPGERRFLQERMQAEERGHERIMARWAQAWYGPRPRRRLPYAATVWRDLVTGAQLPASYRFAYAFATLHWNELNTLRSHRRVLSILERADREAARDFQQIVGEESGHVAWGTALRARIERDAPTLSRVMEHYFELTDEVYPAVISRSHARAWQQLRARLEHA